MTNTVYPNFCKIKALFQAVPEPPPGSGGKYRLMSSAMGLKQFLFNDLEGVVIPRQISVNGVI